MASSPSANESVPEWASSNIASPMNHSWSPEYKLPNRPSTGPLTQERQPLALESTKGRPLDEVAPAPASPPAPVPDSPSANPSDMTDKEAYRYQPAYHNWYYSQHPRDPRVPPPLGNPMLSRTLQVTPQAAPVAPQKGSPTVSPASSLTQLPESSVLAQIQARGNGLRPMQHPLTALRRATANNPPLQKEPQAQVNVSHVSKIANAVESPVKEPPPLRSLGPVARPTSNSSTPQNPPGKLDGSVSILRDSNVPNEGEVLEGSMAATWIDGLPIPASLNASAAQRKTRSSSHSSHGSQNGHSTMLYAPNRAQQSPTLRQYKEEAMHQARNGASGNNSKTPTTRATPAATGDAPAKTTQEVDSAGVDVASATVALPFDKPYQPPRGVWDFMAITGHVVEFACDQDGSRLVQSLLEDPFNLTSIFCEVHSSLPMLVSHQFGNYCAQRLLELGKPTHKLAVMNAMKGRMPKLAIDTYGCRVIQRALDTLTDETTEEMMLLARELESQIPSLVVDQNGNHVVQKFMDKMPPHRYGTTFLISSFIGRMNDIGMHCYGCRVLQKLFETCGDGSRFALEAPGSPYCSEAVNAMSALVQDVISNIQRLVVDQYGNYVVQHLIANGSRETRGKAIACLTPRVPDLSMQKFSSNVVERLLACATDVERDNIVGVLCSSRTFSSQAVPPIVDMTRDKFANYVVQRLIELASPSQKEMLVSALTPFVTEIRTTTYGLHLLSRLERIGWLPQGTSGMPLPPNSGGRGRGRGRGAQSNGTNSFFMGFRRPDGSDATAAFVNQQPNPYSMGQATVSYLPQHNPYEPNQYQQPALNQYQQPAPNQYQQPAPNQYQQPAQFTPYTQLQQPYTSNMNPYTPSLFPDTSGQQYSSGTSSMPQQLYGVSSSAPNQGFNSSAWTTPVASPYSSGNQGVAMTPSAGHTGTLYAQQYAALQQQQQSYNPASFVAAPQSYQGTTPQQPPNSFAPSFSSVSPAAIQAPTQQSPQTQTPSASSVFDPSKLTAQEQQMLLAALAFLQQQQQQGGQSAPGMQDELSSQAAAFSNTQVRHDPYARGGDNSPGSIAKSGSRK